MDRLKTKKLIKDYTGGQFFAFLCLKETRVIRFDCLFKGKLKLNFCLLTAGPSDLHSDKKRRRKLKLFFERVSLSNDTNCVRRVSEFTALNLLCLMVSIHT